MEATIKKTFTVLFGDVSEDVLIERVGEGDIDGDDCVTFNKGEVVEVLKEIDDPTYVSGSCYVIVNTNNDAVSVDSSFLNIEGGR